MGIAPSKSFVDICSAWLLTMKPRFSEYTAGAEAGNEFSGTASTVIVTVLASVIVTVAGPHASTLGDAAIGLFNPP